MQPSLPEPVFVNVEFIFQAIYHALEGVIGYIFSEQFIHDFIFYATLLIILLIASILYSLVRLFEMKREDKKKKAAAAKPIGSQEDVPLVPSTNDIRNETWEAIRVKLLSDNPSDWRLAIIEADIYLDKTLDYKGYHGETIGDKLKQVTPDKLPSIQMAWEAHKIRNRIAHEGIDFNLTMPEARRVLSYYEVVFKDLQVIA